jgi:general secretion pathway protein M
MRLSLSPVVSRTLALAILAALLLLLVTGVVQPVLTLYTDARQSEAQLGAAIARARPLAGELDALRAEAERLKARRQTAIGVLKSPNESLAAAELQDRLKSSVDAVRGELHSIQLLPARDEDKFRRITLRARVSADLPGLQRLFYELESSTPLVFLDNVEVRAIPRQGIAGGAATAPAIDASFDLAGYIRRPT